MGIRRMVLAASGAALLVGCEGEDVNLFTIQDDIDLGQQLADEIASNPKEYGKLLDPAEYPEAYDHLEGIRDAILDSHEVEHRRDFEWEVHIIDDDATLNAFCAPGGYIYIYTGIIRYLEVEDHFAGVLGHEIAHAAERHSTEQMTQQYGIEVLLSAVLGEDPGVIADLASGLVGLQFSRADEAEADDRSVEYLCETDYAANGTAGFFEKLEEEGTGVDIPEFLSTHPSDDNRIADINAHAKELKCSTVLNPNADWAGFQDSLPPPKN